MFSKQPECKKIRKCIFVAVYWPSSFLEVAVKDRVKSVALGRAFETAISETTGSRDQNSLTIAFGFDETRQKHQRRHEFQQAAPDDSAVNEAADGNDAPLQPEPALRTE